MNLRAIGWGGIAIHALQVCLFGADAPQEAKVATVDYFGVRSISAAEVTRTVAISEGDVLDREKAKAAVERLKKLPGVETAAFSAITTSGGKMHLFFGIQEVGAPRFELGPSPTGPECLPAELTALYREAMEALGPAVRAGRAKEDNSQGHSLSADPAMRKAQEDALAKVAQHEEVLRRALRSSSNAEERSAAAWLLGYAPDKRTVTADLAKAARDPDSTVRNNATRSLVAIAQLAAAKPKLKIPVESEVYIDMLNSVAWTDRNKASALLNGLTKTGDPVLLKTLRERALHSLREMALWKSEGHALSSALILGRIAGWPDEETFQAWKAGRRSDIIEAAEASAGRTTRAR